MKIKFRQGYKGPAGTFSPGDVVELDNNNAINICNAGLAFPVKEEIIETQVKNLGGGWYELSNGEKVQCKENAIEAEKKLGESNG